MEQLLKVSRRLTLVFAALLAIAPTGVSAQGQNAAGKDSSLSLSQYAGIEIDSIVIENRNIYNTDEPGYDKFLFKLANKLHIKTRAYVVKRELLQKVGDPFSPDLAEEAARNLRRTMKVYDAWIQAELLPGGNLQISY